MALYKFFDTLTNTRGDSLVGYQVIARAPTGGPVQPIYGDISGTPIIATSGIADTAITDDAGVFGFYITPGIYDLEYRTPDGLFVSATRGVTLYSGLKGDDGDAGPPGGNPDSRIVYARLAPGVKMDGMTDDSAALQAILDTAPTSGAPLTVVFTGSYVACDLAISSNTTIVHARGVKGIRTPGSAKPMWRNKNRVAPQQADTVAQMYARIVDQNISVIGGSFDGSQASETSIRAADGSLLATFAFYGVRGLKIQPDELTNPACYSVHCALVENVDVGGFRLSCPARADGTGTGATNYNQDGVHFNGPARDLYIHDITGRSGDDFVALTADDGPGDMFANPYIGPYVRQGPITTARIERLHMENALYGIRLLSKTSRIDDITIRDVSGTVNGRGFYVDAYKEAGGAANGNVGRVVVDNVAVQPIQFTSGDPTQPNRITDQRHMSIGCTIEDITFHNCRRLPCLNPAQTHFPWLDVDPNVIADTIRVTGFKATNVNGEDQRSEGIIRCQPGYLIRSLLIDGVDWQRDAALPSAQATVPQTGSLLDAQGGNIGVLRVTNVRANRTSNLLKLRYNGNFSVAQISDIYSYDAAPNTGILYLETTGLLPVVTMKGCAGSLKIAGPNANQAQVEYMDPETVSFKANGTVVSKTGSIAGVSRTSAGLFRITFAESMTLVAATPYGYATSATPIVYQTAVALTATYADVLFQNGGTAVDPDVGTLVLTRGYGTAA